MTPNDRGYGLGRSAGEFSVAIATKEMRAQRLPEAHQPPKRIGVCYGFGVLSYSLFSVVLLSAVWRRFASNNDSACLFQLCLNALSARKMRKVCQNRKVNSTQKALKSKRP